MYKLPRKPGFIGAFPWAPVLTFLAVIMAGNWYATQYAARHFTNLGQPLFTAFTHRVYAPFSWGKWLWYARSLDSHSRLPLTFAFLMGLGSVLVAMWLARLVSGVRVRRLSSGADDIHGSARLAKTADIKRAGLLNQEDGLIIGGWPVNGTIEFLRHQGSHSVICVAQPRSGKGVSLVITNLLAWLGSLVVFDPKGENFQKTAGYRASELGQHVVKFSPCDLDEAGNPSSDGWNPCDGIRLFSFNDVKDVQNIVNMLVRVVEVSPNNQHWLDVAESLGIGLMLHRCYAAAKEGRTISPVDVYNGLTPADDSQSLRDYFAEGLTYEHDPTGRMGWADQEGNPTKTHPEVRRHFKLQVDRSDEEFANVVSTLSTAFLVFSDPLVARATSFSSFRVQDLVKGDAPVSVYITIPPPDQKRLKPLLRILFTQVINRNTETMDYEQPTVGENDRLLLMIDEAGSLGRLDALADALAIMHGYHIQAFLIFHDIGQIHELYGREASIMGKTHVKIAFAANIETAEYFSGMTGKTTVARANHSFSGERGSLFGHKQMSVHMDYIARPLMTADEVSRLRGIKKQGDTIVPGEMLIFLAGEHPILGVQPVYLAHEELRRRSLIPPPQTQVVAPSNDLQQMLGRIAGVTV